MPAPGGALKKSIGKRDRESGEARRLQISTDYFSPRGTQGCWHQVGVQNEGEQYLQGSTRRARSFADPGHERHPRP